MSDYQAWRDDAEAAASKSRTDLPEEHVLETMYDDGCEPEAACDAATLARYLRAPATRHKSRNDVGQILAEHRRQNP